MILVTGAAGFIGAKTTETILKKGITVLGIDNLNDYYDIRLKTYRLNQLKKYKNFIFRKADIEDIGVLKRILAEYRCDAVINLAAQAGVLYSIENPVIHYSTNCTGALNLLECCRKYNIKKFVQASTSMLYAGEQLPFKESLPANRTITAYAASKKCAEAAAYNYHYLYGIDITVFRYFTVYGPAGRPDMSPWRFIKWIDEERPLELYGDGSQRRDFAYVDDIAEGTVKGLKKVGFKIINLGSEKSYPLTQMIHYLEKLLGKKARIHQLAFHPSDMKETRADISVAKKVLNWHPKITFNEGFQKTVEWYLANKKWLLKLR